MGLDLTSTGYGIAALAVFVLSYIFVVFEEGLHLRKSKPVLLAAGIIWLLVGLAYAGMGKSSDAAHAAKEVIEAYGELFLFLFASIVFVNVLEERRVFEVLRARLSRLGLSYRQMYWLLGGITFLMSSFLANITTALVMGTVALALGKGAGRFITLTCISIVVASNAGGAFSPFGDTTTLMIWQDGKVTFFEFFDLVVPSILNWLIPATIMQFGVPSGNPEKASDNPKLKPGALGVAIIFALTIVITVMFQNSLGLQPMLGMMFGLGLLQIWAYALQRRGARRGNEDMLLNSFKEMERMEWDTLLFFFGIIFAVGGLASFGWLSLANTMLYDHYGATFANITVGVLSAIVDNIPLVFGVLTMDPQMSHGQWLLVTLTAGTGGSLLSIGSAAGVAMMGIAGKHYTFFNHLKWAWAIALGYAAAVAAHLLINAHLF